MENTINATAAQNVTSFEPVFSDDQVGSFEGEYQNWDVNRRLTLATLSRSSKQLIKGTASMIAENDGDAFVSLLDQISGYREHLNDMTKLADAAYARLILVGEYMTEGEKAINPSVP